jgi:hypothetical protein
MICYFGRKSGIRLFTSFARVCPNDPTGLRYSKEKSLPIPTSQKNLPFGGKWFG